MRAEKRAETAEALCESLKTQLKESQSEASTLKAKLAKCESALADKDVTIDNLKGDLNARSKECGDLKETNRILQRSNEQLEKTIKELEDKLNMLSRESSLKNG
jgi:chromosome segregation ATPase